MTNIDYKIVNGLHSKTKFFQFRDIYGNTIEYHEHPDTGQLVCIKSWFVDASDGDVMPEFEILAIGSAEICNISKEIAKINNKITKL